MIDHPSVLFVVLAAFPVGMLITGWKIGDLFVDKLNRRRK